MDRMSVHMRLVRCQKCWRVFCCLKHRVEHEHRAHNSIPMAAPSTMSLRRYPLKAVGNIRVATKIGEVNHYKRRHASSDNPAKPPGVGLRMLDQNHQKSQQQNQKQAQEQQQQYKKLQQQHQKQQQQHQKQHEQQQQVQKQQEQQQQNQKHQEQEQQIQEQVQQQDQEQEQQNRQEQEREQPNDVVVSRAILKARRSSLLFVKNLRPVAESSPMVPLPCPSMPSNARFERPVSQLQSSQLSSFPSPLLPSQLQPFQFPAFQLQPCQLPSPLLPSQLQPCQLSSPLPQSQLQSSKLSSSLPPSPLPLPEPQLQPCQLPSPLPLSSLPPSQLQPCQLTSSLPQSPLPSSPLPPSPLPPPQLQPCQLPFPLPPSHLQPCQLPSPLPPSSQLTQSASTPSRYLSPPQTPYVATPAQEPTGMGTPVGSALGSPPSFYQTPMQTMPPCPDPKSPPPTTVLDPASAVMLSDKKRPPTSSNSDSTTAHKGGVGFFWSNMARRFRLALRPAKPKTPDAPDRRTSVARCYEKIQPRRPISDDQPYTPVHARPSLEAIRRAHEEATKATGNILGD